MAFFSLVYRKNKNEMKSYAEIALENCNSNSINIWELATLAEANLYLEKYSESEKYYNKVLEKTKDKIRMRSSIYLNAKFAYEALSGMEY